MYSKYAEQIVGDIKSVEVQSEWTDDHIKCAGANIQFKDGSQANPAFWWIGHDGTAALKYYDSPKAKDDLVAVFVNYLEMAADELFEWENDPARYDEETAAGKRNLDEAKAIFERFDIPIGD